MLQILWDTRGYVFWLLVVSAFVLLLERVWPWRKTQKVIRRQFGQDLFWLFFNGHYAGILVAYLGHHLFSLIWPGIEQLKDWQWLATQSLWLQFLCFFLLKDFLEWCVHNLLHRVPSLWEFHKLHHSIEVMDWIGNFRFHWMEIVIYRSFTWVPLIVLGVDGRIILAIAVVGTLIGHLNHSNVDITWGPLRYLVNSSRMHVWHHDRDLPAEHPKGVNFGIVLSLWDWLFRTAWWPSKEESPSQQPQRLGFPGLEKFPRGLFSRLLYPLSRLWTAGR
jgi:sterol desaturase/sphingolipid hydroxylase (fatty acid hydroxylase superfamily)